MQSDFDIVEGQVCVRGSPPGIAAPSSTLSGSGSVASRGAGIVPVGQIRDPCGQDGVGKDQGHGEDPSYRAEDKSGDHRKTFPTFFIRPPSGGVEESGVRTPCPGEGRASGGPNHRPGFHEPPTRSGKAWQ